MFYACRPLFFRKLLPKEYYCHFLLLHYSNDNCQEAISTVKSCIKRFIYQLSQLFNDSFYAFNNHLLLYLPEFVVQKFGSLHSFSVFLFERFLQRRLKKRIRSGRHVLTQSSNALEILRNLSSDQNVSRSLKFSAIYTDNNAIVEQESRLNVVEIH